jgi:hypothetical protein
MHAHARQGGAETWPDQACEPRSAKRWRECIPARCAEWRGCPPSWRGPSDQPGRDLGCGRLDGGPEPAGEVVHRCGGPWDGHVDGGDDLAGT